MKIVSTPFFSDVLGFKLHDFLAVLLSLLIDIQEFVYFSGKQRSA